jgi:hypothetical protein
MELHVSARHLALSVRQIASGFGVADGYSSSGHLPPTLCHHEGRHQRDEGHRHLFRTIINFSHRVHIFRLIKRCSVFFFLSASTIVPISCPSQPP